MYKILYLECYMLMKIMLVVSVCLNVFISVYYENSSLLYYIFINIHIARNTQRLHHISQTKIISQDTLQYYTDLSNSSNQSQYRFRHIKDSSNIHYNPKDTSNLTHGENVIPNTNRYITRQTSYPHESIQL